MSEPIGASGAPHRYFFKLYALRGTPDLAAGATKEELLEAIDPLVVDSCELMGGYRRSS